MIPDFVLQTKEIMRQLQAQEEVTYEYWQDSVANRFKDNFLSKYDEYLNLYINGGANQTGMGLDELLRFIDDKTRELSALSGLPTSEYDAGDTSVHDEHLNRTNWDDDKMSRPGELDYGDFRDVMDRREQNN